MQNEELLEAIRGHARPYLETRGNREHTRSSLAFAQMLLEAEGGDPAVALPAVILHDVGWSAVAEEDQLLAFGPVIARPDLNRHHELEGARIAGEILAAVGYDPELVPRIVEIVRGHDSEPTARSLEDAIVKDADKLHRLTRRGFVVDAERFRIDPAEYLVRLTGLADEWFLTPTGRQLAGAALEDLQEFLAQLVPGGGGPL